MGTQAEREQVNDSRSFTADEMLSFAMFAGSCDYDRYSDGKWYYKVKGNTLLSDDQLLNYWLTNYQ
jgi:hypothetical protein